MDPFPREATSDEPLEQPEREHLGRGLLRAGLLVVLVGTYLGLNPWGWNPPIDVRLLTTASGALLIWASRIRLPRDPGVLATVWIAACAISAIAGVDLWRSFAGREAEAAGLILYALCAFLLAASTGLPRSVVDALPRWCIWLGLAAATFEIVSYLPGAPLGAFWPQLQEILARWGHSSTMGHPLWIVAALSVSIAALLQLEPHLPRSRFAIFLGVLAVGVGLARQGSSALLPAIVFGVWIWKSRPRASVATAAAAILALGIVPFLLGFQISSPEMQGDTAQTQAGVASSVAAESVANIDSRLIAWEANLVALGQRPVLGWGPSNGGAAYMSALSPEAQFRHAERLFTDAHNVFIELAATTGLLGLVTFLALMVNSLPHVVRASADKGWLTGGVAALGFMLLYEPITVQLFPLLFLMVGAARSDPSESELGHRDPPTVRVLVGAVLTLCLVVASLSFVADIFFRQGEIDNSVAAHRTALALAPWRQEYVAQLAILRVSLAGGDQEAIRESVDLARRMVTEHPWDPNVRIQAATIASGAGQEELANELLAEHLERFPADRAFVESAIGKGWLLPGPVGG